MVNIRDKTIGSTGVRRANASMTEKSARQLTETDVEGNQISGSMEGIQHDLVASDARQSSEQETSWSTAGNGWAAWTCSRSRKTDDDSDVHKFGGHA
jgi:hypothetical protein